MIPHLHVADVDMEVITFFEHHFSDCVAQDYITKFIEEQQEFRDDPSPEEAADVVINLIGWLWKQGYEPGALYAAVQDKTAKLWTRTWEKQPDGTYHHVKES